jgi:hypothetical protein
MSIFLTTASLPSPAAATLEVERAIRWQTKRRRSFALVLAAALTAVACTGGAGLDVPIGPVDHSCPVANSCQHGR